MIYGSTKTRMDYILDHGFRRIDSAIEGVIAKYPTPQPVEVKPVEVVADSVVIDWLRDRRKAYLDAQIIQNSYRAQQGGLFGVGGDQNQQQGMLGQGMRPGFW